MSKFTHQSKYCKTHQRYCKFYEEKQTDVAMGLRIVTDVNNNNLDRVIFVTADHDQIPTVESIKKISPQTEIMLAAPPGRLQQARDLGNHVHIKKEIKVGRIKTCLLPRSILDENGKTITICPTKYLVDPEIVKKHDTMVVISEGA